MTRCERCSARHKPDEPCASPMGAVRGCWPKAGVDWRNAPDEDLPTTDPHGTPWANLSADELRARADWCMLGQFHEALRRARLDLAVR